jgi:murein DD-endopeptidase MepM/ murein hydrolase activator NlpD
MTDVPWRLKASILFVALLALTRDGRVVRLSVGHAQAKSRPPSVAADTSAPMCPEGTLPDGNVCVHLMLDESGPELAAATGAHREKSGAWSSYEQIPRLPERPPNYEAYVYPIPPGVPHGCPVISGYDLDRPDEQQRRGRRLTHVGHGGVDLPQARGTPVALLRLDHQVGDAEVLYAGHLFGTTVLTRHTLSENGQKRDYLALHGHLDMIAPGVHAGRTLADGEVLGTVGDTGSPGLVHLHYEIRRVRENVDLRKIPAGIRFIAEDVSIVCDPRNVLPLRAPVP